MKLVIFDLDGTLLDNSFVFYSFLRLEACLAGKEPPLIADAFDFESYTDLYEVLGISDSRFEINARYQAFYNSYMDSVVPMPFANFVLSELKKSGAVLALVSAQKEYLAQPIIKRLNMNRFFSFKHFSSTNKARDINTVVTQCGVSNENSFYVGDLKSDVVDANKAGVVSVAFSTGYVRGLADKNPDFIIQSLKQLLDVVNATPQ